MTTPARPANRHHKRPRGEGQWALGYREPLNKNEENKKNDDGLNVRQRIIDIYSKQRLRLHRPGRPARPDALVRALHPAQARDRRRQDRDPGAGGARRPLLHAARPDRRRPAQPAQLRVIADISNQYGRGTADVTDRQNIQLHWIEIEDVPDIWERAGGGRACPPPRPAATPRASSSAARSPGSTPTRSSTPRRADRARSTTRYIGNPAFSNLPRKFKTALTGCPAHCTVHEINDVAFVGVVNEQRRDGLRPVGRRRPVHQPDAGQAARRLRRARSRSPEVWAGVIGIFRDYGYRRLRHRARIKFLINDWGAEKFREVLEKEYLGYALPDGPAPEQPRGGRRDHVGVFPQKDGNFYVGFAPKVGRLDGDMLHVIADLAERYGSGRVHTTVEQKMVILDVRPTRSTEPRRRAGGQRPAGQARPRSAARRWPAPASSSASWPSSRPRPPRPWT